MKSIPRALLAVAALLLLATAGAEIIDGSTPLPPVGAEGGPSIELTPEQLEQDIQNALAADLAQNGLEIEACSITVLRESPKA